MRSGARPLPSTAARRRNGEAKPPGNPVESQFDANDVAGGVQFSFRSLLCRRNRGESSAVEPQAQNRDASGTERELGRSRLPTTPDKPGMLRDVLSALSHER